jgi:hypothetical protein
MEFTTLTERRRVRYKVWCVIKAVKGVGVWGVMEKVDDEVSKGIISQITMVKKI